MPNYTIIEAPSNLGLKETGVDLLGSALLEAGLARELSASTWARVAAPPYCNQRDPEHGMLNADAIACYTKTLATAIGGAIDLGLFPLVLGGDCSILLGSLLALRTRGRFGLLFADGHADFYQPEANINGEAASSDLALATGRGPKVLTHYNNNERLVLDEDVAVFGFRDGQEQLDYNSQPLPPEILTLDLAAIRQHGIDHTVDQALARVTRQEVAGFWLHLDADVLADDIMPAVDYRIPGGLSWDELTILLRRTMETQRVVGLEITIYNPNLDPHRAIARAFVQALVKGLGS